MTRWCNGKNSVNRDGRPVKFELSCTLSRVFSATKGFAHTFFNPRIAIESNNDVLGPLDLLQLHLCLSSFCFLLSSLLDPFLHPSLGFLPRFCKQCLAGTRPLRTRHSLKYADYHTQMVMSPERILERPLLPFLLLARE